MAYVITYVYFVISAIVTYVSWRSAAVNDEPIPGWSYLIMFFAWPAIIVYVVLYKVFKKN